MADIHISGNGNDSTGDGSVGAPYLTLNGATTGRNLLSSNVYKLERGTTVAAGTASRFNITSSGTSTLEAYGTGARPIFTMSGSGTSHFGGGGTSSTLSCTGIDFQFGARKINFSCDQGQDLILNDCLVSGGSFSIRLSGAPGNTSIFGCTVSDFTESGIYCEAKNDANLGSNGYIGYNTVDAASTSTGDGISLHSDEFLLTTPATGWIVEWNDVDMHGLGENCLDVQENYTGVHLRYNTLRNSPQWAGKEGQGSTGRIGNASGGNFWYGNRLIDCAAGFDVRGNSYYWGNVITGHTFAYGAVFAISGTNSGSIHDQDDVLICNNYVECDGSNHGASNAFVHFRSSAEATGVRILNNVFRRVDNTGTDTSCAAFIGSVDEITYTTKISECSHNYYIDERRALSDFYFNNGPTRTFAEWQSDADGGNGALDASGSVGTTNYAALLLDGDGRPGTGSALIGAGIAEADAPTDADGVYWESPPSIGAYEITTGGTDTVHYVDSSAANDNGAGTQGDPWKYVPGMASANGAHTLASGDVVNIKNGSVFTERLPTIVANVTYQGYGIGGTDIEITYPANTSDVSVLSTVTLARQTGTHEGSWKVDRSGDSTGRGDNAAGACVYVDHAGCTFNDIEVIGNTEATGYSTSRSDTVLIDTDGEGCAFERFAIVGSTRETGTGSSTAGRVMRIKGKNTTLLYGKAVWSSGGVIYVQGSSSNDYFENSTLTISCCELGGNNTGYPDAPDANRQGAVLQIAPVSENEDVGVFKGAEDVQQCYVWGNNDWKSGFNLHDCRAGALIRYCHFKGISADGQSVILINILRGALTIDNNWFEDPSGTLAVIRQTVPDTWGGTGDYAQPQYIVGPDAVLTISNNTVVGIAGPLYQNTATNTNNQDPKETLTFEGQLIISGNKHLSPDVSAETDAAFGNATGVLLWGAASTTLFIDTATVSIDANEWWAYRVANSGGSTTKTPTLVLPPCVYGGSLGSELITNGAFASDTGWTKGTGWTIGSGVATKAAGTASNLTNTGLSLAVGAYKVVVTVTVSAGVLTLYCAGSTHTIRESGTYTFWRKREDSNTAFRFEANSAFAGTVDNVSCKLATPVSILNNANWEVTDNYFRRDPPDGSTANSSRIQIGENNDIETGFGVTLYQETVGGQTGIEKFEAAHSAATGNYEAIDGGTTSTAAIGRWMFL